MTFKRIESMSYGSPDQMKMADEWYTRFAAFRDRYDSIITDWVWGRVHNSDVGYQARRRWMELQTRQS